MKSGIKKQRVNPSHLTREKLKVFIVLQLGVSAVVSVVVGMLAGWYSAYSALAGSMVCVLTNALFGYQVFRYFGASQARKIVTALYIGEAMKLLMTSVAFFVLFYWELVAALPLFVGFIAAQLSLWLAPLVL